MPAQFRVVQTSFSSGEISPEMLGRTDTSKHQNGLKRSTNAFISPFGGVVRRNGSRYVNTAKYNDKHVILIKFVFSVDQSYMLEVGDRYMRFYINGHVIRDPKGGDIYEISTPYSESELDAIRYTQRQDTMFLVHGDHPIMELKRYGDTDWRLTAVVFDTMPFEETIPTPHAYLKFDRNEKEVGKHLTISFYSDEGCKNKYHCIERPDIETRISVNGGVLKIVGMWEELTGLPEWLGPSIPAGNVKHGKYCKVDCKILYPLSSNITAIPNSWTLLRPGWSEELGYPSATYLHQQRLIFASSRKFPRKIWMSTTGNPYNFDTADSSDDDALSVGIDDNQGNKIMHLTQNQVLLALTAGNEFSVTGGYENGIKPSNINIRLQSAFGSSNVRPINVGASMLFVQRAGKQLKAVSNGGYYGTDVEWVTLSEISRHLLDSGIKSMTYQQEPNSMVYVVCNNGTIAALTYNAEQEIAGWGLFETDGEYMNVCCIPDKTSDVVYTAVRRKRNGVPTICIETLDPSLNTDCAMTGYEPKGESVWSGFDHLEGATVSIIADGAVMPSQQVKNGTITLNRNAVSIEVGFNYKTQIELLFQDFPINAGTTVGARLTVSEIVFRTHKTSSAMVYCYGSDSGQLLTSRKFGPNLLDKPPPELETSVRLDALGWDINDINIVIEQDQPLPFHLMAVSYVVTSG